MKQYIAGLLLVLTVLAMGCKSEEVKDEKQPAPHVKENKKVAEKPVDVPRLVQEPVVAGGFYPRDALELGAAVQSYLAQAQVPKIEGFPMGLMVPHAGHVYSGPVAAYCYNAIEATGVKRFVIMGPSHGVRFKGVYVMDKDAYRTPLGEVAIDREAAKRLVAAKSWINSDPRFYGREHSVEVQIPFLQKVLGKDLQIVVIVIGQTSSQQLKELARVLDETFSGSDEIFLASSDMSHGNYPPYKGTEQTKPVDLRTLELIKAMDIQAIEKGLGDQSTPMCGGKPVLVLMNLFKLRGGDKVEVLNYADSGDASGDHSKVVGYGAVAFILPEGRVDKKASVKKEPVTPAGGFHVTEAEKKELLTMARKIVDAAVRNETIPQFETESKTLKQIGAAFVTLKTRGSLRGCIGSIIATEPLYLCIQRRAVDAALHDSRFAFNRIKPEELVNVDIEISVLTPLTRAKSPEEIVVGVDGVILTFGNNRGVFLPQVPLEQKWDRVQYLSRLCGKARVSDPDCWRHPRAVLEKFQAIVFSEHEMGMKVH